MISAKTLNQYHFPAEYERHTGTILIWPVRPGSFPFSCRDAKKTFVEMICAITKSEALVLVCDGDHISEASKMLEEKGITTLTGAFQPKKKIKGNFPVFLLEYTTDDAWARDTAPTFVKNADEKIIGIDWVFNAWGGQVDGLLPSWDKDDGLAEKICSFLGTDRYDMHYNKCFPDGFVLEGGSIHTDGEGTLITTEACLLSKGRNPELSKEEIEAILKDTLGIKKIIWLPHGIYGDETNEHVDNVCAFTKPGRVLLAWTDDKNDPQYAYSMEDLKVLTSETDAKGRKIEVVNLPVPKKPVTIKEEELAGYIFEDGEDEREAGERLAASYVNFYITNDSVLLPQFGDENDITAVNILKKEFPERTIVPVKSRSILLGGGNIHCVTSQIPSFIK